MKGAAEFCLAWLVEDHDKHLTTCPSVSTENSFFAPDGKVASVSAGCTMDLALIAELFANCMQAAAILGVDEEFCAQLETARSRLAPYQVGKYGQLQEWSVEFDEPYPEQRHMSHLYPVYPGSQITPRKLPHLAHAAQVSLQRRLDHGGAYTGWSRAWAIALWARLRNGEMARESLEMLILHSTKENLFDTHPAEDGAIFQVDGNFGAAAALAEMLVQSHDGRIDLLPALPKAWRDGRVEGLCTRGGHQVAMVWTAGELRSGSLTAGYERSVSLQLPTGLRMERIAGPHGEIATRDNEDGTLSIEVEHGCKYRFTVRGISS
jgi:alpha-L-fucosidase 2